MSSPIIGLVPIDRHAVAVVTRDPGEFDKLLDVESADVREHMASVIAMTPAPMLEAGEWGTFFVFDEETRRVVGACGFKAPPNAAGSVEIAYFTFPPYEGHGYATAMVGSLVAFALDSIDVANVIAHTLPQAGASTRVLEKSAFVRAGDHTDPEDGPVWRWRYGP